ncbi:MAG: DUF58 domain-containing protein [Phycisphaerae bacterium]
MSEDMTKYLDPKVLDRVKRLDLLARLVVEGFISGLHRSPFHGFSVEFASYRQYVPGDDIKHIDWKVHGRTDRYYIKQYEEETNLRATFLVDASESMRYPTDGRGGLTKYRYGCAVAASLAFLLQRQQDATALAVFDDALRTYLPASGSRSGLSAFVHALDTAEQRRKTSLEPICHSLAEKLPRRGLVCLISDLLVDDLAGAIRGLEHFRHHGHEVVVLHILHGDELNLPFEGNTQFVGLEEAGRLTCRPRALREGYLRAVRRFCREAERRCVSARMDYRLISTEEHLDAALLAFLSARASAVRKAGSRR